MRLHSLIVDDFLEDFDGWRDWADTCKYQDVVNPADGVTYPGIYRDVPTYGVHQRLSGVMGSPIKLNALFMRLSLKDVPVPHQAHTDAVMGQYSMMLYMNRKEHCKGGTSLVRHLTGLDSNPVTAEEADIWQKDTNDETWWSPYMLCKMAPNRAFIFRADLMHRAEPIGGFGSTARDGRLVMTCFFDV